MEVTCWWMASIVTWRVEEVEEVEMDWRWGVAVVVEGAREERMEWHKVEGKRGEILRGGTRTEEGGGEVEELTGL